MHTRDPTPQTENDYNTTHLWTQPNPNPHIFLHLPTVISPQFSVNLPIFLLFRRFEFRMATPTKQAVASQTSKTILDVLIIGAGWSGLSAALKLSQAGRKVAILEARERIGGRAFTHTWSDQTDVNDNSRTVASPGSNDYWCDFGCSWMHGYLEGSPLKQLTDKYGIPVTIPSPRETVVVGEQGPLPQALSQKLTGNLAKAQEAAKHVAHDKDVSPPEASVSLADFLLSDNSPLFDGLQSEAEKKAARDVARMLHIPLGIELEKASLKWTGFEQAFVGTDAAPKGGFTSMINKLVDEITSLGTSIHTSQEVQSVRDEQSSSNVKIITKQGQEYVARTALVTIPIAVLKKTAGGLFDPALPERRLDTIKRVSVGNLNKVLLNYDQPWWNNSTGTFLVLPASSSSSGLVPASIKGDAEKKLWELYSSTTLIVSSLLSGGEGSVTGASNSLLIMVGGEAGKQLEAFERLEAGNALHAYLTSRIGGAGAEGAMQPKHVFYSRWAKQPFTGGATTSPVSTASGNSPLDFEALSRPLWNGRLGFAGEHTEINRKWLCHTAKVRCPDAP